MQPAGAAQTVSPFPAPPEYAVFYKKEIELGGPGPLLPPPVQSEFTAFGEDYRLDDEIIRSLPSQSIKQLYPTKYDWKSEMKKLNRSVVAAFLDLVDILIKSPDHPERTEKIHDIELIFINMHHLVNEFRPHQARDQLKFMQENQVKALEHNVKHFKEVLQEGVDSLKFDIANELTALDPVPRPSAITRFCLDAEDDDSEMPVLRKEEPQSEDHEQHFPVRLHAKPSANDLRERRKITFTQLPSPVL